MSRPSVPPPGAPARPAWRVRHVEFLRGAREMATLGPATAAWGLVTGVAMVKGGLSVPLALFMTFAVYAGSAQLAAVPLMLAHAPPWVIWAAAACVNLRFVVFSLQWRPYLMHLPLARRMAYGYFGTDMTYVLFMKRFPRPLPAGRDERAYLAGLSAVNWATWQVPSVAGILLGDAVPTGWGLGFAGVLGLLGLGLALVADRGMAFAALVAVTASVAAVALPLKLNIVVAIAAAVAAGSLYDAVAAARRPAATGPAAAPPSATQDPAA